LATITIRRTSARRTTTRISTINRIVTFMGITATTTITGFPITITTFTIFITDCFTFRRSCTIGISCCICFSMRLTTIARTTSTTSSSSTITLLTDFNPSTSCFVIYRIINCLSSGIYFCSSPMDRTICADIIIRSLLSAT